jgi:enamine deaminase RidA (YjgF/YER057c/UK114 family)
MTTGGTTTSTPPPREDRPESASVVSSNAVSASAAFQIINPPELGEPKGWNNGLLAPAGGRILFVAGQTARDGEGRIVGGGFVAQWERTLENVLAVVRAAGGGPENLGRLTIYITDRNEYLSNLKPMGEAYRRLMGRHYPAIALVVVKELVDEGAVIEIEATAVV